MNKAQIAEWLFKRIASKADDLKHSSFSEDVIDNLADDIIEHTDLLKEIVWESIKPF